MSEALDSLAEGLDWPEEPWVCDFQQGMEVWFNLTKAAGNNEDVLIDALRRLPKATRRLLWHMSSRQAISALFSAEDRRPGLIMVLADEERDFDEQGPGTDQDAWKRFYERIRYVVAMAMRNHLVSLQRLSMILLAIEHIQKDAKRNSDKGLSNVSIF